MRLHFQAGVLLLLTVLLHGERARGGEVIPADGSASGQEYTLLHDLATQFNTDKAAHGFAPLYEERFGHLRHTPAALLEVGVWQGASLSMWHAFLDHAEARVVGIDHFKGGRFNPAVHIEDEGRRFVSVESQRSSPADPARVLRAYQYGELPHGQEVYMVDQSDRKELARFVSLLQRTNSAFDVIIDDGSHVMKDQQQTMGMLFPFIRPGGIFVMEDTTTSRPPWTGYGVLPDSSNNWWALVKTWQSTGKVESMYMTPEEMAYMTQWTDSMECFILVEGKSETCLVHKKATVGGPTSNNLEQLER